MPVTYNLHPELGFIETTCFGNVTLEEVIGHFHELAGDPALPDRLDVFLDLDRCETVPDTRQLENVVREVDRLQSRVRWGSMAIVATNDAMFGMSRMFEAFTDGMFSRTQVFRSREEAEAWLTEFEDGQQP